MLQHSLAAITMIGLFTLGGVAAIRYLFPKNVRSPRPKVRPRRLRFKTKPPVRF